MNIEECFRKRLLRKIPPSKNKSLSSIKLAEDKLSRAEYTFHENMFDVCIVFGYMAMFHAARALLYIDGVQEKSHFCIFLYLKEKYSDKIPLGLINSFNNYRIERHETLYGIDFSPSKDDAEILLKDAREFIKIIKNILKEKIKALSNYS